MVAELVLTTWLNRQGEHRQWSYLHISIGTMASQDAAAVAESASAAEGFDVPIPETSGGSSEPGESQDLQVHTLMKKMAEMEEKMEKKEKEEKEREEQCKKEKDKYSEMVKDKMKKMDEEKED